MNLYRRAFALTTLAMVGWAASLLVTGSAFAQGARGAGWEFGVDAIYQDGQDIAFNGGSDASFDDDFGFAVRFGYRFSERLELQFGVDWQTVDYDVDVVSESPALSFSARGEIESFTPWASVNYNFIDGPVTPYVSGGIGYAFIDTNIPNAPPQSVCWWDPWWGYVCGTFQSTRSVDEFTYQAGAGVRWDASPGYSLRLEYARRWIDLGEASSTPDFDQLRLNVTFRY